MRVGVLALQGCVDPHLTILRNLGVDNVAVRTPEVLQSCERLILPGGESSTMLKLLQRDNLFHELQAFTRTKPVWGICAGAILLAQEVVNPIQPSLCALPIRAHRNFYGSQLDSFQTQIAIKLPETRSISVDFIRAPHLEVLDRSVQVLGECDGRAVLLRYKNVLVSAFHTELGTDPFLHQYLLSLGSV
jgi:pyridoxal 5'-phosphate synthase pdxT subunit